MSFGFRVTLGRVTNLPSDNQKAPDIPRNISKEGPGLPCGSSAAPYSKQPQTETAKVGSLYFSYPSILTIGYGESNSGEL
jgi:hypothetical protein